MSLAKLFDRVGEWVKDAACRGSGLDGFYAGGRGAGKAGHTGPQTEEALAVCQTCPVITECREYAIHFESFGVWGGMTEHQRRLERRRRNIQVNVIR